ncbi:formin-like [Zingiber officinale]|uniref:formin-like n=1 Tax=Zingiber officinale TaxID=94328 RepID=UPI001C4C702B|nr:formin-like [Zingiber officinale]
MNDRLNRDASSPSRRRVRLPSEESDSDDLPLTQRLRHRAPPSMPDSGPSDILSPSPPVATTSPPSPPIAAQAPIPSQANVPPDPSTVLVEPPLTQPSLPAQPSTSRQPQSTEAGPSRRPPPVTSSLEPPTMPPSAPSMSAAGPSGTAVGPSQPPPPAPQFYRTTAPSEVGLHSRNDVSTSFLIMKGRLATLWGESMHQMEILPPPAQMKRFSELYIKVSFRNCLLQLLSSSFLSNVLPMSQACAESLTINQSFHAVNHQNKMLQDKVAELELQLNDPVQAIHALRAEIKDLTKERNSLEVSLALAHHELKGLKEEKSQVDIVHQQSMDQQALEHQRAIDQLTQKLRAAETLAQEHEKKLKFQAAQLTSQAAELLDARNELAQTRATADGASTSLALYKEGENDRCQQSRALYLRSPEFCTQAGQRFSTSVIYGAAGALRQLYEQDYLKSAPPPEFLDHDRILKEIPDEIFAPFK